MSYPTPQQPGQGAPQYPYGPPDQSYPTAPGQPYGAPQQDPYGGPGQPYPTQPGQPYGAPQYLYGMPPVEQSNGVSIAAIIFAFVFPLVGLILGIVGLSKASKVGGKGKGLSIAATIISVLVPIAVVAAVVSGLGGATKVGERLNPGCISAESYFQTWEGKIKADGTDVTAIKADFQAAVTELNKDANESTNTSAKAAILTLGDDIQTLLNDINSGTQPPATMQAQLTADGNAVDAACGR